MFAVLAVRFSPNWVTFYNELREMKQNTGDSTQRSAIDQAVLTGYSARGYWVMQQALDPSTAVADPNHKIVRWRLLFPLIGRALHLPGWLILSLAHVGCLVLIIVLVALGAAQSPPAVPQAWNAVCLGLIAGATAPFFTSMGLLGYYDAWLALALLAVAFARTRWIVIAACLLAPWIDERFVLGLPLALWVRWINSAHAPDSVGQWAKHEALLPFAVAAAYTILRLQLSGSGGSQRVGEYLREFVFAPRLSFADYIVGAWEGLRVGWVLVAAALAGAWIAAATRYARVQTGLLGLGTLATVLAGLFTALDLSRSMVLLLPLAPLGWRYASRARIWNRFHLGPLLAAAALGLPAHHVVGKSLRPVDDMGSAPTPLTHSLNTLAGRYYGGYGVAKSSTEAAKWYRKAAEMGLAEAQYNLALMYVRGDGVAKDTATAVTWHRRSAEQEFAHAQHALGVMYALGEGVPKDPAEAVRWYRKAAAQGFAAAQSNLGVKLLHGSGVPKDSAEAVRWFRKAAEQGYAVAQSNLAQLYSEGTGVRRDTVLARAWWEIAAANGLADAQTKLSRLEKQMTAEEIARSTAAARALRAKHGFENTRASR